MSDIRKLTVSFNSPVMRFHDLTKARPFRQILQVEANIVSLRKRIEVTAAKIEQVQRRHRPERRHAGGLGLMCVGLLQCFGNRAEGQIYG